MSYTIAFYTHVSAAAISISLFAVRGYWMLTGNPLLQARVTRVAPHVVDTILLGSAIILTVILNQYPFVNTWLTVKFFALIAYIVLGTVALKRGRTLAIRSSALVAAVAVFGFIVSVAWYHHPLGIFVWLVI